MNSPLHTTLDHFFRHESGKMVAVLSRLLGLQKVEVAQDIVQDTLLQAATAWRYNGMPENPSAWLYKVARHKAIDYLRREKRSKEVSGSYTRFLQAEGMIHSSVRELFTQHEMADSQLRMMFAACHPSIPEESRIAFTLKTLCGLSVPEIASAFLSGEETIAKRIYRAREKIRTESISLDAPTGESLMPRLDAVLKSLYLLFNEGYHSSHSDRLIREELCSEAMRLCYLLCNHPLTALPRTHALLSLFCFQASRLQARLDDNGHIILLKYQDRSRWNRELIQKGFDHLERAAEPFEVTAYHLEAAIASTHAAAPSFEQTDWKSIYDLYEMLYRLEPNPIVAMNKAIASSYAIHRRQGLQELQRITGLEHHHLYFASLGEIHLDLGETALAQNCFEKALELAVTASEKQLLLQKIASCTHRN